MRVRTEHLQQFAVGRFPSWAPLLDQALLLKPSPLVPAELRYLRHRAGWSGHELAQGLGVGSNVSVARWESRARRIPRPTERLFRLLIAGSLGSLSLRALASRFRSSWLEATAPVIVHLYPEEDRFEYRWALRPRKIPQSMHRLFWDTDPRRLATNQQTDYIIARVAEKGDLEDWNWLRWTYGDARIAEALENRRVSPATARFWRDIIAGRGETPCTLKS